MDWHISLIGFLLLFTIGFFTWAIATDNLTIPTAQPLDEASYCATQGDTDMRYLPAKCLKYFSPKEEND